MNRPTHVIAVLALLSAGCGDDNVASPTSPSGIEGSSPQDGRVGTNDVGTGTMTGRSVIRNPSGASPGAVSSFDAILDERGRVVFTWTPPADMAHVTGYAAFWDNAVLEAQIPTSACTGNSCRWVWGWQPNRSFDLSLAAVGRHGDGPALHDTLRVDVHTAGLVEAMSATQRATDGSPYAVDVTWRVPLHRGAADCHVMEFEVGEGSAPASTTIRLTDTCAGADTVFSHAFENLGLSTVTFKVRAQTSGGWGPWDYRTVSVTAGVPLTAAWSNAPASHAYPNAFTATLTFSKPVDVTRTRMLNQVIGYMDASLDDVRQVRAGDTTAWTVTATPTSATEPALLGVMGGLPCWETWAVCAGDERLSNTVELVVPAS